jgi:predicted ferric reductase/Ca2+-binding EF-hand superfamily protein
MPSAQLDSAFLRSLERAFAHLSGADAVIDARELQRALGLRAEYLARRVFSLFDADADGVIRQDEFIEGVRKLVLGPARERLHFAFRVHDHDGDGALDRADLLRMITLALAEDDVSTSAARVERLVSTLLSAADANGDGRVSFDEFEATVSRHPHLLEQMTRDEARWIAPNEDLLARVDEVQNGAAPRPPLFEAGWASGLIVAVWALVNVALFAAGMLHKPRGGHPLDWVGQVARATTSPIELDGALILFPVMRRLLTRLRRSWAGRAMPIDDAIGFHRLIGHTLFALCLVHGTATLVGYARASRPFLVQVLTERALTGTGLLAVFAVMWLCAWQWIRRSKQFEVFYFTHLLYLVWFPLAIAHAPGFLGWVALPLVGLALELVLRAGRRGRATSVVSLFPLRSGVTRVEIRRPQGFAHRAGDYLFLRVPSIARHEWHPFTITSAPERDTLTVHARSLGNWTAVLRARAEETVRAPLGETAAYVDGPYGSPSGHIFESRFAVLIGAGIGVTPFASILESIVLRANAGAGRPSKLERAHFFWLNRDRYSFEWFAALLAELERIDGAGILDVNIWMTGGRAGATAAALELARELSHRVGERDLVTGLRGKTQMGHPDWDSTLRAIRDRHAPARVDVYFCGPPGLGRTVRRAAARLGMRFRDEKF